MEARKSPTALLSFCTMTLILVITLIIVGLLAGASLPSEGEKGFSFKATFLRLGSVGSFLSSIFFKNELDEPSVLLGSSESQAGKNSDSFAISSKMIQVPLSSGNNVVNLHYLEAGPDSETAPVLVLLHGQSFSSQVWVEIGTLNVFSSSGIKVYALDLPGHGKTVEEINEKEDRESFLNQVYETLKIPKSSFVVSPSMSGRYSFPFLIQHSQKLSGYVPISPAGIQLYSEVLKDNEVPTLVLWGEKDNVDKANEFSKLFKNAKLEIIPGAGHACYKDDPSLFHNLLLSFIKKVTDF